MRLFLLLHTGMPEHHQRRLTSLEASFLYREQSCQPMHIGGCGVYEGHISRQTVVRLLEDRLHLLPRYRQKVVAAPFGIAHPSWEDDPHFDLSHHVEERTLPEPGDDRVLSTVGGRIFAEPLDRARPLWKLSLIRGRHDGNTAIIAKVHYAMVEGVTGTALTTVLHDVRSDAPPTPTPPGDWKPAPIPDFLAQLQNALRDNITTTTKLVVDQGLRLWSGLQADPPPQRQLGTATDVLSPFLRPVSCLPFNGRLSGARQFAWTELAFPEIRAIRSALGGTVNDVVLTIISGGLGSYLRAKGHKLESLELRLAYPVMFRRHTAGDEYEDETKAPFVSTMIVPLYPGIADPVQRFAAEHRALEELKTHRQAQALAELQTLSRFLPPAVQALSQQFGLPNSVANTVSLNVPGPQIPLYLAGHKRLALYPIGPLSANIGLFHVTSSYHHKLTIGVTVDPHLMPDVWHYTDCLHGAFQELREAADRATAPSGKTAQHVA